MKMRGLSVIDVYADYRDNNKNLSKTPKTYMLVETPMTAVDVDKENPNEQYMGVYAVCMFDEQKKLEHWEMWVSKRDSAGLFRNYSLDDCFDMENMKCYAFPQNMNFVPVTYKPEDLAYMDSEGNTIDWRDVKKTITKFADAKATSPHIFTFNEYLGFRRAYEDELGKVKQGDYGDYLGAAFEKYRYSEPDAYVGQTNEMDLYMSEATTLKGYAQYQYETAQAELENVSEQADIQIESNKDILDEGYGA